MTVSCCISNVARQRSLLCSETAKFYDTFEWAEVGYARMFVRK